MPEITIQNIKIFLDGSSVTFLREDKPDVPVTLPTSAIDELIDFLSSLNQNAIARRRAFRVAVPSSAGLMVRFALKGKSWSATPVDLSLAGILIEFSRSEGVDIPVDTTLSIELRLNDKIATLTGLVRRRDDNQYGILFLESLREGELNPPETLVNIYKEIERQWLRARLETE
ncbi:MAG: PilZ domain-containing protein [Deltaproteobacteria bacterium]|nr:PilZ domain-containing protein [Deltaproteobacteria bacterium]